MKRLIEKGLMFGQLVEVSSPVMVARYNRALKRLTGKETELTDFWIDVSGYSPEIGLELEDPLYLNPNGVNRQFILLTPEQKSAPLLNAQFSFSRDILRGFISRNEAQLFALTTQDAVAGELLNSIFVADAPARLLEIGQIEIEADTTDGTLDKADELAGKIDRFMGQDGAWHDDLLIAQMIELAKSTGDVTRNPLQLKRETFEIDAFWTAHFGGAFVWRTSSKITIMTENVEPFSNLANVELISFSDRVAMAQFLFDNNLVEPILQEKGAFGADIVQQKMDFIVADVAANNGAEFVPLEGAGLRRLTRRFASDLPQAFHTLYRMHQWATGRGRWPKVATDDEAYFYLLRAAPGPYRDLANRLLAALTPLDIQQLFICHKEAFYGHYGNWPEAKKDFAARYLEAEYLNNKATRREALFGRRPALEDRKPVEKRSSNDLIEAVGPWAAVRRGKS